MLLYGLFNIYYFCPELIPLYLPSNLQTLRKKLNILYYFAGKDSFMDQWQSLHIFDELERAGHVLTIFNPLTYQSIEEANERLPAFIIESKPAFDLFVNPAPSTLLFKITVQKIRAIGLPSVLICFDNLHAPFIHKEIAPYFDLVWLTSKETDYLFKKWGCTTVFQPYAANPQFLKPMYRNEILKVGFVGNVYDDRAQRINLLTNNSVPCTVYSTQAAGSGSSGAGNRLGVMETVSLLKNLSLFGFGRKVAYGRIINRIFAERNKLVRNEFLEMMPSPPFDVINSIYSDHALSLNITELRNTYALKPPVHKLHLRTFEIAMSGGLQIAPYVEELASYFEDGEEIVLCRDDEEFISKSRFYLQPEKASLRSSMKQKARLRAETEHTWILRFNHVFGKLFGE